MKSDYWVKKSGIIVFVIKLFNEFPKIIFDLPLNLTEIQEITGIGRNGAYPVEPIHWF